MFNALRPTISLQAALLRDSKGLIRTPAKMPLWGPSYLGRGRGHKTRGFFSVVDLSLFRLDPRLGTA
jgi:hypothetical protein